MATPTSSKLARRAIPRDEGFMAPKLGVGRRTRYPSASPKSPVSLKYELQLTLAVSSSTKVMTRFT